MGRAKRGYEPLLDKAMSRQPLVLTITGVSVALAVLMATRMGSEFIPSLDEHDIAAFHRLDGTLRDDDAISSRATTRRDPDPECLALGKSGGNARRRQHHGCGAALGVERGCGRSDHRIQGRPIAQLDHGPIAWADALSV